MLEETAEEIGGPLGKDGVCEPKGQEMWPAAKGKENEGSLGSEISSGKVIRGFGEGNCR